MAIWTFISQNAQALIAVFSLIGSIAAAIALFFAIPHLKVIRKTQQMEGTLSFLELTRAGREDRKFVYTELPTDLAKIREMSEADCKRTEKVVASLNDVGLLLDQGAISKKAFFSVYHTMIIRLTYKLQPYIRYHESRIGGRYGRRLEKLARRAKLYHDIHPKHRKTVILLDSGGDTPDVVYKTGMGKGLGRLLRRKKWFFRRRLRLY